MSKEQFDDKCPGCRPVVLDLQTKQALSPEHPIMLAIAEVWKTTTLKEREAFHKFTCLNSRDPAVMTIVAGLNQRIQKALDGRMTHNVVKDALDVANN
jgi:hypothetical protein